MSKSSSSTQREVQQLEKQEKLYEALKEQVLSQAPTSDCKKNCLCCILLVIHLIFKNARNFVA